jgi:ubiquinone biosynthesis protein Coq4
MHKQIVKIRSKILVLLTHNVALPFLQLVRNPVKFPYTKVDLLLMEKGTLGNDLYHFLKEKKIELLPYYAKHDVKHILLGYDTTDEGEACLQYFMLGNKHISFPVFITVLFGLLTMPEYWNKFFAAYKRGASATSLKDWKWFDIITQPTLLLQQKIIK